MGLFKSEHEKVIDHYRKNDPIIVVAQSRDSDAIPVYDSERNPDALFGAGVLGKGGKQSFEPTSNHLKFIVRMSKAGDLPQEINIKCVYMSGMRGEPLVAQTHRVPVNPVSDIEGEVDLHLPGNDFAVKLGGKLYSKAWIIETWGSPAPVDEYGFVKARGKGLSWYNDNHAYLERHIFNWIEAQWESVYKRKCSGTLGAEGYFEAAPNGRWSYLDE